MGPRNRRIIKSNYDYQTLEDRRVLSGYFPSYVNGTFSLGTTNTSSPYPLADTFNLESNPSASKTIYLDFDGFHSVNNSWGHDIMFPSYNFSGSSNSFSTSELIDIQEIYQNMAEDFLPFDVNVTTQDPGVEALRKTSSNDNEYGGRVVFTQPTSGFGNGIGGVAFLNSFDDSIDNPSFVFVQGDDNAAMAGSHEAGHMLGLNHDGLGNQSYHPGTGSGGNTSWGPILGAPYFNTLTQWSNGDYSGATNTENDVQIITSNQNGFDFRNDDYGGTTGSASALGLTSATNVDQWGIIERRNDVDMFSFTTGAGNVTLDVLPFYDYFDPGSGETPNLDVFASLLDSNGNVIATSNPVSDFDASFDLTLNAGTYFISVDGTGKAGVYSDYGSLGFYRIEGTIQDPGTATPVGEEGTIVATHVWQTVNLTNTFNNPVVIAGPLSENGGDPAYARVRNVTSTSFEIHVEEYNYLNGFHNSAESFGYMVVEAGVHTLADGTVIAAGNVSLANNNFSSISYGTSFSSTPVVLSQVGSENGGDAVKTRTRNTSTTGFDLRMQEEQNGNQIHATETVGWLAIDVGTGTNHEATLTGATVTHASTTVNFANNYSNPIFFANMQTFNGADNAAIRSTSLNSTSAEFYLEEEKSKDSEVQHNAAEEVGYLVIGDNFFIDQANIPLPSVVSTDFSKSSFDLTRDRLVTGFERDLGFDAFFNQSSENHDAHNHDGHEDYCTCEACTGMYSGNHGLPLPGTIKTNPYVTQSHIGDSLNEVSLEEIDQAYESFDLSERLI